jgi:ferritin
MAAARFVERLNEQIAYEFAASQQYIANAVYYDAQTLPRLAAFFYAQAVEERNHAMMMVRYLLDADAPVAIPGVAEPESQFGDLVAPVALALEQERRVSDQIAALMGVAREEGDFQSEQFVQWFLKEQVEEVATMSSLLAVVERSAEFPMTIEDYVVREWEPHPPGGGATDPTAPPAAGGAL